MARLGVLAVSAAAILWAAGGTVAGGMFERGASPLELTAARAWISFVGIGGFALTRPARGGARPHLFLVVAFGMALTTANTTYYVAISRLPVAIAIVIQYTAPALVVVWTAIVGRRAPSRPVLAALLAVMAGVVLLAGLPSVSGGLDALGLLAAAGSSVSFAVYMLTGERMTAMLGPVRALGLGFAVASVFWVVLIAARGRPDTLLDPSFAGGIAFLSVGATIAPFLLFLWGMGYVGASRAGIVSTLEPLSAALFSLVWLGQSLTPVQVAGGVAIIAGIALVQSERPAVPEVAPT